MGLNIFTKRDLLPLIWDRVNSQSGPPLPSLPCNELIWTKCLQYSCGLELGAFRWANDRLGDHERRIPSKSWAIKNLLFKQSTTMKGFGKQREAKKWNQNLKDKRTESHHLCLQVRHSHLHINTRGRRRKRRKWEAIGDTPIRVVCFLPFSEILSSCKTCKTLFHFTSLGVKSKQLDPITLDSFEGISSYSSFSVSQKA